MAELPWIRLLNRWPPSDEVLQKVADLAREDMEGHFGGTFVFDPIVVVPKIDHTDEEYLYIYIVFDGDQALLDSQWTRGLVGRIGPAMREMGIMSIPNNSFVEKSEWPPVYKWILRSSSWTPLISSR